MKKYIAALAFVVFFVSSSGTVFAEEEFISPEAYYDLAEGGTQLFEGTDEEGNEYSIEVSGGTASEHSFIQPFALANKTYTITKSYPLKWKISYKVSIKDNKISTVHSPAFTAYAGSFSSTSLVKNSSTKATATANWKRQSATGIVKVITIIANGKLIVSD